MNIVELRQKKASLVKEARSLLERAEKEKREGLSAEEQAQYDKTFKEIDSLTDTIGREERINAQEMELAKTQTQDPIKPDPGGEKASHPRATAEYRKAFNGYLRGSFEGIEKRALMAGSDSEGGFIVAPQQFVAELLKAVDDLVVIRQLATVQRLERAESLGIPSLDADPGDATWTSEVGTVTEDTALRFGKRELRPHPLAKLIKVSDTLIRKSVLDIDGIIRNRLAYKFAVTQEKAFLTGDGAQKPLGVFTASATGIPTSRDVSNGNTTTSIMFDGLMSAKYALKGQYWPKARWIFHRDAQQQIAKLKDGNGQYIWRESVRVGEPDRLLNLPISLNEYAPNTFTTGLYAGILGDFSFYWIAEALDFTVKRLEELYAVNNQIGIIGRAEIDGMPVLSEAFVRVKLA